MKSEKQKVSIKDIAKELGISITTVSFVINGKAKNRISDKVIKKVEDYIEKVGYRPNSSAQSLRTGKSQTIVFMAEDISDPFFSTVAKEMEGLAFKHGYRIIYCSTENKKERALELLQFFKDKDVDAFIITPPENFESETKKLIEEEKVVVLFDRHFHNLDHHYVVLDNVNSTKNAVEFLKEKGFKNIGFVGLKSNLSPMQERHQGYLEAVPHPMSLLIKFNAVGKKQGNDQLEKFLDDHPAIDAILFATNSLAIAGLRVLRKKSIQVPEQLGVATFDDRELFELHTPSISVVSQPVADLAKELIKGTLKLLGHPEDNTIRIRKSLSGTVIPRKSTERN
ncbi:LacI family DNA-binding transcriptional regulator [Litoribacter ruber]|uniref:LacI family DNA-binding transcriptional regulator n=1 Tax=Litoribacter ruber TaxID=702568 RepID=UPI001BD9641B|nr:LacI family DNA-binding transcriptional regulator [Litoribacter ruber]MBT0812892.1 LacI family DNA-binding transcriptional regulator [Litoribacter ruber]